MVGFFEHSNEPLGFIKCIRSWTTITLSRKTLLLILASQSFGWSVRQRCEVVWPGGQMVVILLFIAFGSSEFDLLLF